MYNKKVPEFLAWLFSEKTQGIAIALAASAVCKIFYIL